MRNIRLFGAAMLMSTTLLITGNAFAEENVVAPTSVETPVSATLSLAPQVKL